MTTPTGDRSFRKRLEAAGASWRTLLASAAALAVCAWIVVATGTMPRLAYSVGDVVRSEIVTPERLSVPDPERTEALRAEAAAGVVPVFEYQPEKNTPAVEQLRGALARLGAEWAEARAAGRAPAPAEFAAAHVAEFPLGDAAVLELFARHDFDPALADAVVRALERRSTGHIIADDVRAVPELQVRSATTDAHYPLYFRNVARLSAAREAFRTELLDVGGLTPTERRQLGAALEGLIAATLVPDEAATEQSRQVARESVPEVRDEYQAGQIVAYRNQRVDERVARALAAMRARSEAPDLLARAAALFTALVVVCFGLWRAVAAVRTPVLPRKHAYLLVTLLLLGQVALARFGLAIVERLGSLPSAAGIDAGPHYLYAIPVAVAALVAAMLLDGTVGFAIGLTAAPLLGMLTAAYPSGGLAFAVFAAASSAVASQAAARYHTRYEVVRAGLVISAAQAVVAGAVAVLARDGAPDAGRVAADVALAAFGGLLAATLAAILLPIVERAFDVLSDVRLLELANADHELLRELAINAPGTHQHSYVMSSVATEAAKAIGANPLLVRIGAYFHDVGKLHAPHMFVENLRGAPNPHDDLDPAESARVIIRHVSYGVERAEAAGLPPQICELITGHHGTRTLHFFLEKARRMAPEGAEVDESLFRYPGPKPRTKESAILMLADGAEAAVRSLDDPSREAVEEIVGKIADTVVADHQLEECGITLEEVARVRDSIVETLLNVHHKRIKYPGFNPTPAAPGPRAVATREEG